MIVTCCSTPNKLLFLVPIFKQTHITICFLSTHYMQYWVRKIIQNNIVPKNLIHIHITKYNLSISIAELFFSSSSITAQRIVPLVLFMKKSMDSHYSVEKKLK